MEKIKNFCITNFKKLGARTGKISGARSAFFVKRKILTTMLSVFIMLITSTPVFASGVSSSTIVTGTTRLIGDLTTWLMVLAPVVAGLLVIYFCIRRSAADEMDVKKCCARKYA